MGDKEVREGDKKYKGTRGQGSDPLTNYTIAYVTDDVILSCRCDAPVDLLAAELRTTGRRAVGRVREQSAAAELVVG